MAGIWTSQGSGFGLEGLFEVCLNGLQLQLGCGAGGLGGGTAGGAGGADGGAGGGGGVLTVKCQPEKTKQGKW